jgi:hypothetical protein
LTPLVDGRACLRRFIDQESHQSIFSSTLLFSVSVLVALVAMLIPYASAQACSYQATSLTVDSQRVESTDAASAIDVGKHGSVDSEVDVSATTGIAGGRQSADGLADSPTETPKVKKLPRSKIPDFNRDIYYKNKLEFSMEAGWLPINVPFPFDVFEGDAYELYPLRYTLVPILASLRWHLDDVGGPLVLRGNYDVTFTGEITAIPRGAETHYLSYDMGVRRNFVPRNWRVTPYFDLRAGLGLIDAKGPLGVYFAQGQNFTFNLNMGSGVRYNFNPRYGITAGLNWMHISNANLSSPLYSNYGINVYGPMFGLDIQLRKHRRHDGQ